MVLLEVLVALFILVGAGAAAVTMAGTVSNSMARARERDVEYRAASAFFDGVALWSRDDLDRHLGNRPQGQWRLDVDRPWTSVYTLRIIDTVSGKALLETSVYRPTRPPR